MDQLTNGLKWIADILKKHDIPFQITGGLAAHAYGATRPINDIDIDIPEDRFAEIFDEIKPCLVEGPARTPNPVWDVFAVTMDYHGQEIDIGGAYDTRILDVKTGIWHDAKANFATAEIKAIFGIDVPIVNKDDLIEYKSWLAIPGNHHEQDIREIQKSS